MQKNKNSISRIIRYLRTLKGKPRSHDSKQAFENNLKKLGAKFLDAGWYTRVYCFGDYVIKYGSESFFRIKKYRRTKVFKTHVAKAHWIHPKGIFLVGEYVKHRHIADRKIDAIGDGIRYAFKRRGIRVDDLHGENLVWDVKRNKPVIIDYGCLLH